jgi:hypothetical protein
MFKTKNIRKTDGAALEAISRLAKFMVERSYSKKAIDPTSVFDPRLVNEVEVTMFKINELTRILNIYYLNCI